jgi:hypothetical protein
MIPGAALLPIVVDNSPDRALDAAVSGLEGIVVLRPGRNAGFAGGNNLGITYALAHGAEYVWLLNNDTTVDPGVLTPLVAAAASDARIAVQSSKIRFAHDPSLLWYAGGVLSIPRGVGRHRGMLEKDAGTYDSPGDTDYATGCSMFFTRTAIEQMGGLDAEYFMYFEDADWCVRALRRGFRIQYTPASIVYHHVSASTKIDSPLYLYFTMRNKLLFVRKHSDPLSIVLHTPYFIVFYGRHLIRMALKWHSWDGVRAVWWGITDGILGQTGIDGAGRIDRLTAR